MDAGYITTARPRWDGTRNPYRGGRRSWGGYGPRRYGRGGYAPRYGYGYGYGGLGLGLGLAAGLGLGIAAGSIYS